MTSDWLTTSPSVLASVQQRRSVRRATVRATHAIHPNLLPQGFRAQDTEVDDIVRVLLDNAERAKALVAMAVPRLKNARPTPCPAGCDRALEHALITSPTARSPEVAKKLEAVAGRVLKG